MNAVDKSWSFDVVVSGKNATYGHPTFMPLAKIIHPK